MAKMVMMKNRKKATLIRPGTELISDWIRLRIEGIEFIARRGLRMRNIRSTFSPDCSYCGKKSNMLTMTTTKSSQFQLSRR